MFNKHVSIIFPFNIAIKHWYVFTACVSHLFSCADKFRSIHDLLVPSSIVFMNKFHHLLIDLMPKIWEWFARLNNSVLTIEQIML